jgi:hypothetical protein
MNRITEEDLMRGYRTSKLLAGDKWPTELPEGYQEAWNQILKLTEVRTGTDLVDWRSALQVACEEIAEIRAVVQQWVNPEETQLLEEAGASVKLRRLCEGRGIRTLGDLRRVDVDSWARGDRSVNKTTRREIAALLGAEETL